MAASRPSPRPQRRSPARATCRPGQPAAGRTATTSGQPDHDPSATRRGKPARLPDRAGRRTLPAAYPGHIVSAARASTARPPISPKSACGPRPGCTNGMYRSRRPRPAPRAAACRPGRWPGQPLAEQSSRSFPPGRPPPRRRFGDRGQVHVVVHRRPGYPTRSWIWPTSPASPARYVDVWMVRSRVVRPGRRRSARIRRRHGGADRVRRSSTCRRPPRPGSFASKVDRRLQPGPYPCRTRRRPRRQRRRAGHNVSRTETRSRTPPAGSPRTPRRWAGAGADLADTTTQPASGQPADRSEIVGLDRPVSSRRSALSARRDRSS